MDAKRPEISQAMVKGFVENDAESIESIVRSLSASLYYFLYGMVKNKETVEDLVQESFAKAWKSRENFDLNKNFKTWLFTIGRNTAIDFLRKHKEKHFYRFENEDDLSTYEELISDETINRLSDLDDKITFSVVQSAMDELPEKYRTVLDLRFRESLSFEEI